MYLDKGTHYYKDYQFISNAFEDILIIVKIVIIS